MDSTDTMNQRGEGDEKIFHLIERLGDKLDDLIRSLPGSYVQKVEYDPWRSSVEGRLLMLETDVKSAKEWGNAEHKGLVVAIQESERRIMTELKDNSKNTKDNAQSTRTNRLTIWLCAIGWFITIIIFIINIILAHPW